MPPFAQLSNFLTKADLATLLEWTLANEDRFTEATIRSADASVVNPEWRIALACRDLAPVESMLRSRFLAALPILMDKAGASGPEPRSIELEIAAHGDGAHYRAHSDIPIGPRRKMRRPEEDRVLSAVLYFYLEPKGFSGGELRLFRLGSDVGDGNADPDTFVEIQPLQNSLVVFHSWVQHEVRPVSCPSRLFRDYRFAVNCWFRRTLIAQQGQGSH